MTKLDEAIATRLRTPRWITEQLVGVADIYDIGGIEAERLEAADVIDEMAELLSAALPALEGMAHMVSTGPIYGPADRLVDAVRARLALVRGG